MPSARPGIRTLTALALLVTLASGQEGGRSEPLLHPGPFPVGFRSSWCFDEGRTYRTEYDGGETYGAEKAPRPVLVLHWYPAEAAPDGATPMPHGEYFALPREDPRLARFADALAAHARTVFVQQVMGRPEAELETEERSELERALAEPTPCRRGAEPAAGPFPLVVQHSGAGSSFEDDAALCAFLASHGYVVLGSAFPKADGSSLGIDGGRGSAEDVQHLVRWARALPSVDGRRVALVGHSAGAQAMLKLAAQPGCPGDALVLLDTTQDYYTLGMPQHESLVREATEGVARLTRPMLVAAGPEAMFALCDRLVNAERTYLTVPELGHDEYISQGLQRLERIARRPAAGRAGDEAGEAARLPAVRASYRALCESVRSFLDAALGRARTDFDARLARDRALPWSHLEPRLVQVPRGAKGPEPYDPESGVPPTPRQFRELFEGGSVRAACVVLERFRDHEPRGPLYSSTMMAGSLLYGLLQSGRREEAELYHGTLKGISLPVLGLFEFLAHVSTLQGKPEQALHFLRLAHELEPGNASIAAALRALEESRPR